LRAAAGIAEGRGLSILLWDNHANCMRLRYCLKSPAK